MARDNKKKHRFGPRFVAIIVILCGCAMCAALYSQEQKLKEIEAQREALAEEYQALQNEQQRVGYMIEYAQSEEYQLQYAREKLGYVMPDDIKFDLGE